MQLRILIIEDDAVAAKHLARAFERGGSAVRLAHTGTEGLEAARVEEPDVLLLDLNLPDIHGLEVLREMKELHPACETVIITGSSGAQPAIDAMKAGAFDYIVKPLNMESVMLAVERVAATRSLQKENRFLREQYESQFLLDNVGIHGPELAAVFEDAARFAHRELPVLILGESGTGKELVARHVHARSAKPGERPGPFIPINCSALPAGLAESELFGYAPGAFTGAERRGRDGKMKAADGGSVFLDEVGELAPETQAKLLRFLENKRFFPVGSTQEVAVNVKVICATNRNLADEVAAGRFRKDLFFRINVGLINIPPLRERRREILPLTEMFLRDFARAYNRPSMVIGAAAGAMLQSHHWPGNVRELKNMCERIVLVDSGPELTPGHLKRMGFAPGGEPAPETSAQVTVCPAPAAPAAPAADDDAGGPAPTVSPERLPETGIDLEKHVDALVLAAFEKNSRNQSKTARYLGVTREVLRHRLKKLGLLAGVEK